MKEFLRKNTYYILTFIALASIGLNFYVLKQNDTLKQQIHLIGNTQKSFTKKQFKHDSTMLMKQEFKEESYIRQLETNTNFFLWLIPVLIAIFALISFKASEERINALEKRVELSLSHSSTVLNGIVTDATKKLIKAEADQEKKHQAHVKGYEDLKTHIEKKSKDLKEDSLYNIGLTSGKLGFLFVQLSNFLYENNKLKEAVALGIFAIDSRLVFFQYCQLDGKRKEKLITETQQDLQFMYNNITKFNLTFSESRKIEFTRVLSSLKEFKDDKIEELSVRLKLLLLDTAS